MAALPVTTKYRFASTIFESVLAVLRRPRYGLNVRMESYALTRGYSVEGWCLSDHGRFSVRMMASESGVTIWIDGDRLTWTYRRRDRRTNKLVPVVQPKWRRFAATQVHKARSRFAASAARLVMAS